jgi:hypothetical protein
MPIKSKPDLTIELNQNITDALQRQNTAARVRQIIQDIIDSMATLDGTGACIIGGSYSNGTITFTNSSGGTFSIGGFVVADTNTYVTGGTYSNGTALFTNSTGGTFNVSGFAIDTNTYVTGGTYSNGTSIFTNSTGGTFSVSGYYTGYTAPVDVYVTGGTYSSGTATFRNNTGGTFNVTGFVANDTNTYVTGATTNNASKIYTFTNSTGGTFNVTGLTDIYVTGGTYSNGTAIFTNNTGGTFSVTGLYTGATDVRITGVTLSNNNLILTNNTGGTISVLLNNLSGLTVNGNLITSTISATTYLNLPTDIRITGGTYSNGTTMLTNNTGGTVSITGYYTGYTAPVDIRLTGGTPNNASKLYTFTNNTGGTFNVSALTDIYTTGGTYSNGSITISNNTGGTFNITGLYTGYTPSTDIRVTGGTYSNGTTTFRNNTGGTFNVSGYYTGATDIYTTGLTFNNSTFILTNTRNDGSVLTANLSILSSDVTITGGTYNPVTGIATFYNNSGATFNVSGFTTGITDTRVSSLSYSNNILTLIDSTGGTFNTLINSTTGLTNSGLISTGSLSAVTISATTYFGLPTDIRITGGTYSNGIATYTNNTGGTFNITGFYTGATDIRITGGTYSNGTTTLTNNTGGTVTINGYYTGATDVRITGGTYSNGTAIFTNNTGGTFSVTGLYTGYTAPIDIRVTGGTYNASTDIITFTNNTGGTFNVTGVADTFVTGGTFSNVTKTATLTNNAGSTFNITGFSDTTITGVTYSGNTYILNNSSGGTLNLTGITSTSKWGSPETVNYNGTGSYSVIGDTNQRGLFEFGLGDFSIELFFQHNAKTPITNQYVLTKTNTGAENCYFLIISTSNQIRSGIQNASPNTLLNSTNHTLVDGQWYHYLASYDRDGNLSVYVNNVLSSAVPINSLSATSIANNRNFVIGSYHSVASSFWKTNLGLVRMYNVVLSATEVTELYNNGRPDLAEIPHNLKWGTNVPYYTSDFSVDVDGWASTGARLELTANVDGISDGTTSYDNVLMGVASSGASSNHGTSRSLTQLTIGKRYRVQASIYIPSGQTNVDGFKIVNNNDALITYYDGSTGWVGNWIDLDTVIIGSNIEQLSNWSVQFVVTNNGNITGWAGSGLPNDDLIYIYNVNITEIGAVAEYKASNSSHSNWYDNSTNNLHLTHNRTQLSNYNGIVNDGANYYLRTVISGSTGISGGTLRIPTSDVTGFTNNNNLLTISNSTGGTLSTLFNTVTGLTINGNLLATGTTTSNRLIATGITATTISATTYINLPVDIRVTGGTPNNSSKLYMFTNNTGGTFNVSALTDIFVTGGSHTLATGISTFTNNTGGTFNVTGYYTGYTVPVDVFVNSVSNSNNLITLTNNTGGTISTLFNTTSGLTNSGLISTGSISAATYVNLPVDIRVTGGTYNGTTGIATLTNNTGGTFTITGFLSTVADKTIIGIANANNLITLTNNTGGTLSTLFNTTTGLTNSGLISTSSLSAMTITASTIAGNPIFQFRDNRNLTAADWLTNTTPLGTIEAYATDPSSTSRTIGKIVFEAPQVSSSAPSAEISFHTLSDTVGLLNEAMRINRNQLVGIGTTLPVVKLHISGNSNTNTQIRSENSSGTIGTLTAQASDIRIGANSNHPVIFSVNAVERMRIDTNNVVSAPLFSGVSISAITMSAGTYLNLPIDIRLVSGTHSLVTGISTFTNNTGGTFNVSGYYTGYTAPIDVRLTGGTYNATTDIITFTNNTGGTFNVTGIADTFITGGTFSNVTQTATFTNNAGTSFNVTGFNDVFITGATTNNASKIYTFTNNTGGTFNVSGLSEILVTGGTPNNVTKQYTFTNNTGGTFNVLSITDIYVTGGTYSNGTTTLINNTGGTITITGYTTGGTSSSISITGITNNSNLITLTNSTGGTLSTLFNSVTGLTSSGLINAGSLSATSISASTKILIGATTGSTSARLTIKDGHIQSQQTTLITSAATFSPGWATYSMTGANCTDTAGYFTLTTTGTTAGTFIVTYINPYNTPPMVVITPAGATAAADMTKTYISSTANGFTVHFGSGIAAGIHNYFYHVIETQ